MSTELDNDSATALIARLEVRIEDTERLLQGVAVSEMTATLLTENLKRSNHIIGVLKDKVRALQMAVDLEQTRTKEQV